MNDKNTVGFNPEQFIRKSKVDAWAKHGLGKSVTAVEGYVELFSAFLYKLGVDVGACELERWLDTYYQLRYEAEREADMAKFVAEGCKVEGRLEPIVPKINTGKPAPQKKGSSGLAESLMWPMLLAVLFSGHSSCRCSCGPEVKDKDEQQELPEAIRKLLSEQEYDKLSPAGKAFAKAFAEKFKPETKEENNG